MTVVGPPSRRLPYVPQIQPPDYLVRALLTRDGFVGRFGSGLGAPGVEIPVTWRERITTWWRTRA